MSRDVHPVSETDPTKRVGWTSSNKPVINSYFCKRYISILLGIATVFETQCRIDNCVDEQLRHSDADEKPKLSHFSFCFWY